jgi:threonylcarbamoyladenosine tRNA methylthiotransferase MtaB
VPFARGKSRSRPPEEVLDEARALFDSGFGEVILTGVHVGRYGEDFSARCSLADLLKRMIESTDNGRIRISSLDPDEIDDDMVRLFSDPGICRHLHLSLQSGSENVLEMMERSGGVKDHADLITKISQKVPGISIGADIIAGFPGETDADFEETLDLVNSLPFTYLQVFPYSQRPGTKAAAMKEQLPFKTRKSRAARLQGISAERRANFYGSQVGQSLDVIVVSKRADREGYVKCISDNYVPVMLKGRDLKYRNMYNAVITSADKDKVYGTIA